MSILSSQADPPTLKNLDFMKAGARFSKNQGLWSKDALDGVLGLSWARFGCSWGLLGGSFGASAGSRWHPEFFKLFMWAPLSPPILAPEEPPTDSSGYPGALMARQMAPRSHQGPSGNAFGHISCDVGPQTL